MPTITRLALTAFLLACTLAIGSHNAASATEDPTPVPRPTTETGPETETRPEIETEPKTTANPTITQAMPTFSITYKVENDFVVAGEADFRLSKKEDHYQLLMQTTPTGMFRFSKKGKIREIAELPSLSAPFLSDKYSYTNYGDRDRSYTSMYNRQKGEATIVRGNTSRVAIDPNAVDRLSMTLALMHKLREQPDIEKFSIDTIDNDGTQTFRFVSHGQVKLKTDIGTLTTTRIDRDRSNSNRVTITWFATLGPDAIPVPVQIEQYKRDKLTVRLKISDFAAIK